jgi:protocatechuate 3,4-dioxygenase beta subunit
MKTDPHGRYRFESIRPGPYPNARIAAHVHLQVWGDRVQPQWVDDVLFEDDPNVPAADKERSRREGRFAFVHAGGNRGGVLEVGRDIRLKSSGNELEGSILHGIRACGGR